MREEWRDVPGFEDYRVSNLGKVWSKKSNREIGHMQQNGYMSVTLYSPERRWRTTIHCVVALSFIGPSPENLQVNHKDGIKINNRVDNLEYVTHSENQKHAYRLGLKNKRGEKNHYAKLSDHNIKQIRRLLHTNLMQRVIGEMFGVSQGTVSRIKNGRIWSHV